MTKLLYTQLEYRIWISASILLGALIGKDFTLLISSFWIGWTVSKVEEHRRDIVVKQLVVILIATIFGTVIGYKFSLIHLLEINGWI